MDGVILLESDLPLATTAQKHTRRQTNRSLNPEQINKAILLILHAAMI